MSVKEKQQARAFRDKYHLRQCNVKNLLEVIEEQGYTVVRFRTVGMDEDVAMLVQCLQLEAYIQSCKCFTYQDDKYRLLFLNDDLTEDEQLIVLAHEEGHIWNRHMVSDSVFGSDVQQEYQANEFAHYLLQDRDGKKQRMKTLAVWACVLLVLVGGVSMGAHYNRTKLLYTDHYYRTASGSKYHLQGCMYLQKAAVQKLTEEEFASGEYQPCAACIPFDEKEK